MIHLFLKMLSLMLRKNSRWIAILNFPCILSVWAGLKGIAGRKSDWRGTPSPASAVTWLPSHSNTPAPLPPTPGSSCKLYTPCTQTDVPWLGSIRSHSTPVLIVPSAGMTLPFSPLVKILPTFPSPAHLPSRNLQYLCTACDLHCQPNWMILSSLLS